MKKLCIVFTMAASSYLSAMQAPSIQGRLELVNFTPFELSVSWDKEKDRTVPAKVGKALGLFAFDTNDLNTITQLHVKADLGQQQAAIAGAKITAAGAVEYDLQKTLQEAKEAAMKEEQEAKKAGAQPAAIVIGVNQSPAD